jgi:hypothetical protein
MCFKLINPNLCNRVSDEILNLSVVYYTSIENDSSEWRDIKHLLHSIVELLEAFTKYTKQKYYEKK